MTLLRISWFFAGLGVCFHLWGVDFPLEKQVVLLSSATIRPAMGVVVEKNLYFTHWLGRSDCPGFQLFRMPLVSPNDIENVEEIECVFRIWVVKGKGYCVTSDSNGIQFSQIGPMLKPVKAPHWLAPLMLRPRREVLDTWLYFENPSEGRHIQKGPRGFQLNGVGTQSPIRTGNMRSDEVIQFPAAANGRLVFQVRYNDAGEPAKVLGLDLSDSESTATTLPIIDPAGVTGLSWSNNGLVVSMGDRGKIFWYGPHQSQNNGERSIRFEERHNPFIPWSGSEEALW